VDLADPDLVRYGNTRGAPTNRTVDLFHRPPARPSVAGDGSGLAAWAVGALFIPTLALALGVWSGSSKLLR
jgi:hypothetical protein